MGSPFRPLVLQNLPETIVLLATIAKVNSHIDVCSMGMEGLRQSRCLPDRFCSSCASKGLQNRIVAYQLNFDEAIYLCPNYECLYPLDLKDITSIVIKRKPMGYDPGGSIKSKKRRTEDLLVDTKLSAVTDISSLTAMAVEKAGSSGQSVCTVPEVTNELLERTDTSDSPSNYGLSRTGCIIPVSARELLVKPSSCAKVEDSSSVNSPLACAGMHAIDVKDSSVISDLSLSDTDKMQQAVSALPAQCSGVPPTPAQLDSCIADSGLLYEKSCIKSSRSLANAVNHSLTVATFPGCGDISRHTPRLSVTAVIPVVTGTCSLNAAQITAGACSENSLSSSVFLDSSKTPVMLGKSSTYDLKLSLCSNCSAEGEKVSHECNAAVANTDAVTGFSSLLLPKPQSHLTTRCVSSHQKASEVVQPSDGGLEHTVIVPTQKDITVAKKEIKASEVVANDSSTNTVNSLMKNCDVVRKDQHHNETVNSLVKRLFLFWSNADALCWLDVAMAVVVQCQSLKNAVSVDTSQNRESCIRHLLLEYDRVLTYFRRSSKLNRCHYLCGQGKVVKLETSVGCITVKTGGGSKGDNWLRTPAAIINPAECVATIDVDDVSGIVSDTDQMSTSVDKISKEAQRLYNQAKKTLVDVRDYVFERLQGVLHCQRGQHDSALLALSELLLSDQLISDLFTVKYSFTMKCNKCDHFEENRVCKEIPTFLKLPVNFTMSKPCFLRSCFSCLQPDQMIEITFEHLPAAFFCHFMHGVIHSDVSKYDFVAHGRHYYVTSVIQHCSNPSHFICHFRQIDDGLWMVYDDLKPAGTCQFKKQLPAIPPSEVHIVLWESRLFTPDMTVGSLIPLPSQPMPVELGVQPSNLTAVPPILLLQSPPGANVEPFTQLIKTIVNGGISEQCSARMTSGESPCSNHQQAATFSIRGTGHSTTSSGEDRLQRAREKFLKDKESAAVPAFIAVVPPPLPPPSTKLMPSQVNRTQTKPKVGPDVCKVKIPKENVAIIRGRQRKQSQQLLVASGSNSVENPAALPASRVPGARIRSSVRNPYESVLPLIHKTAQDHSSPVFNSFSGYVPKAHRDGTRNNEQFSSIDAGLAQSDDLKRPRVCFSVPFNGNSAISANVELPDNDDQLSTGRDDDAIQNADNPVSASSTEMPSSSFNSSSVDADFIDDMSKLCDEIIACDTFIDSGAFSGQLPTSSLVSAGLSSDEPVKDDLQMPVPVDEFTLDDMMAYLFN